MYLAQRYIFNKQLFHRTCFKCARCQSQLTYINAYETQNGQYCCEVCPDEENLKPIITSTPQPEKHDVTDQSNYFKSGLKDRTNLSLKSSSPSNLTNQNSTTSKKKPNHCDTPSPSATKMDKDLSDLNILNKCTTDDAKVNSVQNSIKFFDKLQKNKKLSSISNTTTNTSPTTIVNEQEDKRWSYQKAIEMKYKNNKVNQINNEKDFRKKQHKFERNLSNIETIPTENERAVHHPKHLNNRTQSLNELNTNSQLNNYVKTDAYNKTTKDNINTNKQKIKDFEKILILNQKKNINDKLENRKSKYENVSVEKINNELVDGKINEDIGKLIRFENTNNELVEEDSSTVNCNLVKTSLSSSTKNLTETSFLNVSSTSLNEIDTDTSETNEKTHKNGQEIDDVSVSDENLSERSKHINKTLKDIENISQQIENLNVNNTVHKPCYVNSKHIEEINNTNNHNIGNEPRRDALGNLIIEPNSDAINEQKRSEYDAIQKTINDSVDFVNAINSHSEINTTDKEANFNVNEISNTKYPIEKMTSEDELICTDTKNKPTLFERRKSDLIQDSEIITDRKLLDKNIKDIRFSPLPDVVIGLTDKVINEKTIDNSRHIIETVDLNEAKLKTEEISISKLTNSKDMDVSDDLDKFRIREFDSKEEIKSRSVNDEPRDSSFVCDDTKPPKVVIEDDRPIQKEQSNLSDVSANLDRSIQTVKEESSNPFGDESDDEDNETKPSLDRSLDTKQTLSKSSSVAKMDVDYPEELNPFGDDDLEEDKSSLMDVSKTSNSLTDTTNPFGDDFEDADKTNPFFSDLEDEDKVELKKTPVPTPRKSLLGTPETPRRHKLSPSTSSLNSASGGGRKKKPAPPPPPMAMSTPNSGGLPPVSPRTKKRARSSAATPNSAQPESATAPEVTSPATSPSVAAPNFVPHKSMYGQWKRKKGPAPPRPVVTRRAIQPMPIENVRQELADIEIKQQELERQGVKIEERIRTRDGSENLIEELSLQLFELVNEKNELLRRQAELMYLRRQHNLEEEHAELEFQIRCLMVRPEKNKTDSDKEREEQLIQRLVEVVERRNEIVELLEKDRLKELEEDKSVISKLNVFAKDETSTSTDQHPSILEDTSDTLSVCSSSKHSKTKTLSKKVTHKLMKTLAKSKKSLTPSSRASGAKEIALSNDKSLTQDGAMETQERKSPVSDDRSPGLSVKSGPECLGESPSGVSDGSPVLSLRSGTSDMNEDSESISSATRDKKSKTLKRKILSKIQKFS